MLRMKADTRVDDCATPSKRRRVAVLRDGREIDAVRQLPGDLVEDVHDFRPRALQFLDDVHARDEARLVGLEAVDLLDLLVELGDLFLEPRRCARPGR